MRRCTSCIVSFLCYWYSASSVHLIIKDTIPGASLSTSPSLSLHLSHLLYTELLLPFTYASFQTQKSLRRYESIHLDQGWANLSLLLHHYA